MCSNIHARAPRSRDLPLPSPLILHARSNSVLRARDESDALESKRPAGAALLLPQGGAREVGRRPHPRRCATTAVRVGGCLRAAERVLMRASQDRSRDILRVWRPSLALPGPTPCALHGNVGLVVHRSRTEERGCDERGICMSVGSPNGISTSGSISRAHLRVCQ